MQREQHSCAVSRAERWLRWVRFGVFFGCNGAVVGFAYKLMAGLPVAEERDVDAELDHHGNDSRVALSRRRVPKGRSSALLRMPKCMEGAVGTPPANNIISMVLSRCAMQHVPLHCHQAWLASTYFSSPPVVSLRQ